MRPAYLEHINKIRLEFERDRSAHGIQTVIGNLYALVAGAIPQNFGPSDMKRTAREQALIVPKHVHVREVCGKDTVIFGCRRTQYERTRIAYEESELG